MLLRGIFAAFCVLFFSAMANAAQPVVNVTATDSSATEGVDTGTFTFTIDAPAAANLTVNFTVGGTATSASDYTSLGTNVVITAGQTSATKVVTTVNNTTAENNETVVVTLSANASYTLGTNTAATVTIIDDDLPLISITASDATATEGPGNTGTYTFTRVGNTINAVTVNFTVAGTATSGDYTSLGTSIVIPAGGSTATLTLTPTEDTTPEANETVIVTISTHASYTRGTPNTATVTITDNETHISITTSDATATENGDTGSFTVTRTGSTAAGLTVNFTVGGTATSATDYTALGTSLLIPAGQASAVLTVSTVNDTTAENDETVTVTLAAHASYYIDTTGAQTVTIKDDDPNLVTISAADAQASEPGTDTGAYTVTRVGNRTNSLVVNYTMSGTASSGLDYTALSGSVTINAGAASANFVVAPLNDTEAELNETIIATLSAGSYTIGATPSATVNLIDNEQTVSVTATDNTATETGPTTGVFTFSRAGVTTAALIVPYTISGSTANGTDHNSLSGSITIAANQASATITVTPVNDTVYEGNEVLTVTISASVNYTIGTSASASINLIDNDVTATITATDASAAEPGTNTALFTITLNNPAPSDTTVSFTRTGTASSGTDYTALPTSVLIPTGQTSATVPVTAVNNTTAENDETVILTLSANANYIVGTPSAATVTVIDDDKPSVAMSAPDNVAVESGGNNATLRVTRVGTTVNSLVVNFTPSGTAVPGTDVQALAASVTIPAGQSSADISIVPINNSVVNSNRTLTLTITANTNYTISGSNAAITLYDDEPPVVTVSTSNATAAEPGTDTAAFTVTRQGSTLNALVVNYTVGGTASSGVDFTALSGTATILAGATTQATTITALDDVATEDDETVIITLATGAYTIGAANSVTTTIIDNEQGVRVIATTPIVPEAGTGAFKIERTGLKTNALTVFYAIAGTATSGLDYTTLSGTAIIGANQSSVSINVSAIEDSVFEEIENIEITLVGNAAYTLLQPSQTTLYMADNDIEASIQVTDGTAVEGFIDTATITILLNQPAQTVITIPTTISGSAMLNADVNPFSSSFVIQPGQYSSSVQIVAAQDGMIEQTEGLTVTLNPSQAYQLGAVISGSISIMDSPPTMSIEATNAVVEEGGTAGMVTVTRTLLFSEITFQLAVTGNAVLGTDYTITTELTFPSGQSSIQIPVTALEDTNSEGNESIIITIIPSALNYKVGIGSATLTLVDNEYYGSPSALVKAQAFDSGKYINDPVWKAAYMAASEPSRIAQRLEPSPTTPRIRTVGSARRTATVGQLQTLSVSAPANSPVTFFCPDGGVFSNGKNVITIETTPQGVASANLTVGRGSNSVLVASPMACNFIRFIIQGEGQ